MKARNAGEDSVSGKKGRRAEGRGGGAAVGWRTSRQDGSKIGRGKDGAVLTGRSERPVKSFTKDLVKMVARNQIKGHFSCHKPGRNHNVCSFSVRHTYPPSTTEPGHLVSISSITRKLNFKLCGGGVCF